MKRRGKTPLARLVSSHSIFLTPGQAQVCYMQSEARDVQTLQLQWDIPSSVLPSSLGGWCAGRTTGISTTASMCKALCLCLNVLSVDHATQLQFFICIKIDLLASWSHTRNLHLYFYESGHKFTYTFNRERYSFLMICEIKMMFNARSIIR